MQVQHNGYFSGLSFIFQKFVKYILCCLYCFALTSMIYMFIKLHKQKFCSSMWDVRVPKLSCVKRFHFSVSRRHDCTHSTFLNDKLKHKKVIKWTIWIRRLTKSIKFNWVTLGFWFFLKPCTLSPKRAYNCSNSSNIQLFDYSNILLSHVIIHLTPQHDTGGSYSRPNTTGF